jgi:CheY-like chemotaxis protein
MPTGETPALVATSGRILVIDDEDLILKTTKRLLGHDHEVVTLSSGEAARAILEHDHAFDVILCDLMMPEVTGMDLHQWLAARQPALAERVVFVTGGAFTPKATAYLAGIANLKLEKPVEGAALKRLVAELVLASRTRS